MIARHLALALCLVASAGVLACDSGAEEAPAPAPAAHDELLTPYVDMGLTLAGDETKGVVALGEKMSAGAQKVKDQPGVAELLAAVPELAATDLEEARAAYKKVSEGVIAFLRANPERRAGYVLAYCPMTFEGEGGHWVQREGELMNPFEGSRMLHCGEFQDW